MTKAMKNSDGAVVRSSGNVFADLDLPNPDEHRLKADLVIQIGKLIKLYGITQAQAAERMGVSQPDVSKILRGRYANYSVERLLGFISKLGMDVEIVLSGHAAEETEGHIRVRAA